MLVGYIIFLQQCSSPEVIREKGEVEVHRDTITVVQTDTVWMEGPTQVIEVPVPAPTLVRESSPSFENRSEPCQQLRDYSQPFTNSYASGTMYARTRGWLESWRLELVPRVRQIDNTKKEYINKVVSVPTYYQDSGPGSTELLLGAGLEGNLEQQSIVGTAGISRRQYNYQYQYDLFLKTHQFSIIRKFSF